MRLILNNTLFFCLMLNLVFCAFSCQIAFDQSRTAYKYEREFRKYLADRKKTFFLSKKKFILILYANSCSKCQGDLLSGVSTTKKKEDIGIVFVGKPDGALQRKIVADFATSIDSVMEIHHFELNIGGPCFFEVDDGHLFNQTSLNEKRWAKIQKEYGL